MEVPASAQAGSGWPPIEIGWILDGRLEAADREASELALEDLSARLRREFPRFDWRLQTVVREIVAERREEPIVLLDLGASELALHRWDFAFLVTASDLVGTARASLLGAVSRALGAAVLSTFRLDPRARRQDVSDEERRQAMRRRLVALALHLVGRLGGLGPSSEPTSPMALPEDVRALDRRESYSDEERALLEGGLERVADARIEERHGGRRYGALFFHLRAAWEERREILHTVWSNRPWLLPLKLSRLTTAAASALVVLLLTAEAWELGTSQSPLLLGLLSLFALTFTSAFVLRRQRLLPSSVGLHLTEQVVLARVAVVLYVLIGMICTYLLLFATVLFVGDTLFAPEVLTRWVGKSSIGLRDYALQAAFGATMGILIGALGASFEGQHYVRHVAYVDGEV